MYIETLDISPALYLEAEDKEENRKDFFPFAWAGIRNKSLESTGRQQRLVYFPQKVNGECEFMGLNPGNVCRRRAD